MSCTPGVMNNLDVLEVHGVPIDDTNNQPERDVKVKLAMSTFMSFDPAQLTDDPTQHLIVMSIEREENKIEQIAFSHHDGQIMLGALLEVLADQGSTVATALLKVISDNFDEDNANGEYNETQSQQEEDDEGDHLNGSTGEFGTDA